MQTTPQCWRARSCSGGSEMVGENESCRVGSGRGGGQHVKPSRATTGSRMISMVKYLRSHGVRPFVHAKHNMKGRTTAMHTHREWGKREARAGGGTGPSYHRRVGQHRALETLSGLLHDAMVIQQPQPHVEQQRLCTRTQAARQQQQPRRRREGLMASKSRVRLMQRTAAVASCCCEEARED